MDTTTTLKSYNVRLVRGRARITRQVCALNPAEARALALYLLEAEGSTGWTVHIVRRCQYAFSRSHKAERAAFKRVSG